MSKFNALAAILATSMLVIGGLTVSGEAQADDQVQKTISGDSGSIDVAAAPAAEAEIAVAEKELTRKEKRAAKREARRRKTAETRALKVKNAQNKKKKSGLICKREKVTGSNFTKKVCRSQAQIEAQRKADQEFMRDIRPVGGGTQN